ncbi:hypothetical protein T440DRAFT_435721 [Plenodomus tracheiphilus IPT5]|uniref:Uncharacterized protein n=1 Tax=Plenodomus tracheiphilus IPT5 TaxID=1408161 RepID=A0A6A7ARQ2_9PLEO|nr:hypothetical protein T440DRAFT_435721 [Plenodomus tracheiphilus IPT5]
MAPPGFSPPGYSVPQRYMHREPPPEGADTNTRPYFIFFGYLATCFGVAVFIILKLLKRVHVLQKSTTAQLPPKKHVWLFAVLSAGSLLTTWTHMFHYFKISYDTWLMWRSYYELDPHQMHWGLWLKETSLFREAWETVIIGNARYWWSHQIFFFALGLGLHLEQKGIRRGIKYTWAFMLLGQIVAISFATNLFFLALLLSPPAPPPPSISGAQQHRWLGPWLLNLFAIFATAYPAMLLADEHYWHHPTAFMPVLLAPHIALMILPLLRSVVPARYFNEDRVFADKVYSYMWALVLGNAGLMLAWTTATAYAYSGMIGVWYALSEHPAVSSVGYDVIFCWVSWVCWYRTQSQSMRIMSKSSSGSLDEGISRDATGSVVGASGVGGATRRR